MNIRFDSEKQIFRLDTEHSAYIMAVRKNGYLQHLYYGAPIHDDDLEYMLSNVVNESFSPWAPSAGEKFFALDTQPQEYSCNGTGDYRISAFSVEMPCGSSATALKYVSHRIFDGKPALCGMPSVYTESGDRAKTLEITMLDSLSGAEVLLSYSVVEGFDAIMRHVCVKNTSDQPFSIEKVYSACVDFNRCDFDLIHFYGVWAAERSEDRKPLIRGISDIASKRGSSSHNHNPFIALCSHDTTEDAGEAYGFTLCYSGNFSAKVEVDGFEQTRVLMGINPEDFRWRLAPGETFTSPEAVMVYSAEGLGEMSRRFHKLIRKRICRGKYRDIRRPILINNWEATYFDFDTEKLLKIARAAAPLGIEMLVMDDGWFGKRNSDACSIGDWVVNEEKLPGGLSRLTDELKKLGMKFGLWFEPEIASFDSDIYRAHPDWVLHVAGRDRSVGRETAVLDFSRKEVVDHVFTMVSNILRSADISYVKWDFNRNLTEVGSAALSSEQQKEVFHRYVLGVYDLAERLTSAFPDVLFEGCSGGGGRFDVGMLYYFPQIWTSDDTDAFERTRIQYGTSFLYPVSAMSAHVSASPNHQTHRAMPFSTRGDVATSGSFGYELDLSILSDKEKEQVKMQVERYKALHDTIANGDFYRLVSPFENPRFCAWESVSEDKSQAVLTYVVTRTTIKGRYFVRLKGLIPDARYREKASGKVYYGDTLMNAGLNLGNDLPDASSAVLVFDRI